MGWLRGAAFLGVLTALACSSSGGGGSATVMGTVAGMEVPTTDAVAVVGPLVYTFGAFTQPGVVVVISNKNDLCSIARSTVNPPNSTELIIAVGIPQAVTPGIYTITTSMPLETTSNALLGFEAADAECKVASPHGARSGTITLSTISSTTVDGSFDVALDTGEKLSGTFRAPVCGLSTNTDAGVPNKCGS
jgi:hypothetical protein